MCVTDGQSGIREHQNTATAASDLITSTPDLQNEDMTDPELQNQKNTIALDITVLTVPDMIRLIMSDLRTGIWIQDETITAQSIRLIDPEVLASPRDCRIQGSNPILGEAPEAIQGLKISISLSFEISMAMSRTMDQHHS